MTIDRYLYLHAYYQHVVARPIKRTHRRHILSNRFISSPSPSSFDSWKGK